MSKKILLVDDDTVMLRMLEKSLSATGFMLAKAGNGKDAVTMAKNWQPDLIILDIIMPEMDGGEAAELLERNPATRQIPIIFLTSLLVDKEAARMTRSTGRTYMAKPLDENKLIAEVRKYLS